MGFAQRVGGPLPKLMSLDSWPYRLMDVLLSSSDQCPLVPHRLPAMPLLALLPHLSKEPKLHSLSTSEESQESPGVALLEAQIRRLNKS